MNQTTAINTPDAMHMTPQQADEDVEYYPRLKRAPYIHDASDFGLRQTRTQIGSIEMDVPLNDQDGDATASTGSTLRTSNKAVSSSNLSQFQTTGMRRRSSLARVFSSLGMATGPSSIAEGASLEGYDVSGETNPLMLLPNRIRRGSSVDVATGSRGMENARDRVGSSGNLSTNKYPQWALHDPASIVMKDGLPVTVGTLIQHHLLLNQSHTHPLSPHSIVTPTWRLRERMKTVGVCLILALNIGTDPPDLNKPTPCAKLQCWLDPTSISRAKAKERIGERLEQQYAKWQQRSKLKYRRAIDPTIDTVKDLCLRMRESAKNERVLLHYNGHGVPRPTGNGEIWLFDRHHTNYIPLSVTDLRRWIGKPSIVVLDCSGAGTLMPYFTTPLNDSDYPVGQQQQQAASAALHRGSSCATMDNSDPSDTMNGPEYAAIRDTIVLCPTALGEWLPLNPELPADLFTSCLTTPIPIALRWFVHQNPLSMRMVDLETIADVIPGKLTDRKTPLGELNWIFTAITDTIAWNVLPSSLFQRLFRQDLLVASMFRNFLLAERILRSLNCSPTSIPEIPSTCNHPLWNAWDLAVETCLHQLIDQGYLRKSSTAASPTSEEEGDENASTHATQDPQPVPSADAPFFAEQLTAFEIWLEYANTKPKSKLVIRSPPSAVGGSPLPYLYPFRGDTPRSPYQNPHEMDPPVELPIVLQVLLSQAHRVRALVLLKRFLDLGPSAVNLALSVGIFPYVLKLLQSPIDEYKHVLVAIWARIMTFDESCQVDVVKDRALSHFIRHLNWGLNPLSTRACFDDPSGGANDSVNGSINGRGGNGQRTMAAFILSVVCSGYTLGQSECINENLHVACSTLLQSLESPDDNEKKRAESDLSPTFRTWLCICLGNLTKDNFAAQSEVYASGLHLRLFARLDDASADVRAASCYALGCLLGSAPIQLIASAAEPQPPLPPELSPTIQRVTGSLSGTFNPSLTLTASTLMPTFDNLPQHSYGLGFQPYPSATGFLAPGNEEIMFGAMAPSIPPPQTDDHQRMELDMSVSTELTKVLTDASPLVRFEAVLALNRFVAKYASAIVSVAGDSIGGSSQRNVMAGTTNLSIPLPSGMNTDAEKSFSDVWTQFIKLYRSESQPSIRSLLNSIVMSVNERVMSEKSKLRQQRKSTRRQSMFSPSAEENTAKVDDDPRRNATGTNLSSYVYGSPQSIRRSGSIGMSIGVGVGTPPKVLQDPSGFISAKGPQTASTLTFDLATEPELPCPESKFYLWKKIEFADRSVDGAKRQRQSLDLLSDIGAIKKYRSTRNHLVQQKGQLLKDSFSILAQKPPSSSPYSTSASDLASGVESEIDMTKEAINLHQTSVLQNSTARGTTSLLRFHPYEPALVVCGAQCITCWNAETSERMLSFANDNPKNTRMTAASWINETNTSLLLTGCSDGSVRIWDGLFEPNDEISKEKPTLVSSFFAINDLVADRGSTGLILSYQGGQLIAGGSTKQIRCWDIESEKCRNIFETKSDAMLTTLTSAWNHSLADGYSGLGPDIVIGGFSNGALKLYDTRSNDGVPTMHLTESRNSAVKRRLKCTEFEEHSSWIIDVAFTTFGGRHEVISGCVAGSIKYWDIRYSSSMRTLDHKMQMTALTVHSNIPMLATGSPAQFIKMISHDGTTQQVIRYHEKIPGQRIGPVSCLSFHPQMPYLAAGFSDDIVSVYAPNQRM